MLVSGWLPLFLVEPGTDLGLQCSNTVMKHSSGKHLANRQPSVATHRRTRDDESFAALGAVQKCDLQALRLGVAQAQGAQNLILDLRQNPGGLVRGSVDIARLFLDSSRDKPTPIFTVAGKLLCSSVRLVCMPHASLAPRPSWTCHCHFIIRRCEDIPFSCLYVSSGQESLDQASVIALSVTEGWAPAAVLRTWFNHQRVNTSLTFHVRLSALNQRSCYLPEFCLCVSCGDGD